ncbi:MAG: hypothetical protein O9295_08785 [Microcystis sp. LE18-22.4A]|nr:hypothetical protein [Microcystis sp. LE18-22.4A]
MTPSKSVKPHTPHPTPYTLPLGKTFCRRPYLFSQHPTPHTPHPTRYTPHPTPHTLSPRKTFCRRP